MVDAKRREFMKIAAGLGAMGALGTWPRFAFGADNSALSKQRVVMNSYPTKDNDFMRGWARGVEEASAALNMVYRDAVYNQSTEQQRASIENAPLNSIEAMVVLFYDAASSTEMMNLAQQTGIAAANNWSNAAWNTPLDIGEMYCAYQTSNDVIGTQLSVEAMFEAIGGKGKFVNIIGIPGNSASDMRQEGVHRALKKYPGIEMVAEVSGGFNRGGTLPVMEGVLASHSKIDAVYCASDDSAIGAITALEARKMQALVTSVDGIPELLDLIKQGRAYQTLALTGGWFSAYSTVRVFDKLNGVATSVPESMLYAGTILLDTPDSAAGYKALTFEEPKFPFDYALMSKALNPDSWDPQNILAPLDPAELWSTDSWNKQEKPAGYELPEAYRTMRTDGSFDKTKQTYADHFKKDPYKQVRDATHNKKLIV